jgi:hypothetical protein
VSKRGHIGATEACPACHPRMTSAAVKAERILDSLMLPALSPTFALRAVFRRKAVKAVRDRRRP